MIYRIAIANVPQQRLADTLQLEGLSATLTPGLGTGSWGQEPTTVIEMATLDSDQGYKLYRVVIDILRAEHETAVYVTRADHHGVVAYLWYAAGKVEVIG